MKFSKLGKCNLHFLPRGLNIGLIKDFAFVRVFGTIRATRKTGDKGVTVFHNLDADAISEVYISDSALRQPKDSGNAKMLVACLRVVSLRCQFFFRHIYKATAPPARVNLWVGGWIAGSCWIVLKTAVKRDAVLCGATCRKIFVFPTLRVGCV